MILIVTLNLAVDHIVAVDELRLGEVHRARRTRRQAGGKGVNVARVMKTLGGRGVVTGFLGGHGGRLIADGLRREGLASSCIHVANESRTCLILHDEQLRRQTVVNEPGPPINEAEWVRFTSNYASLLTEADIVVVTGSLPPNLPDDTYARLIETAHQAGKRVLLDCSSVALRAALRAKPFLVKVNHSEAAELLSQPVTDVRSALDAVEQLRQSGAAHAMITLGARGAAFAYDGARYSLLPPKVEALNSVGSGDAVMAGLAVGLARNWDAMRIGACAVAAGAANALHGGGRCSAAEIAQLAAQVAYHIVS